MDKETVERIVGCVGDEDAFLVSKLESAGVVREEQLHCLTERVLVAKYGLDAARVNDFVRVFDEHEEEKNEEKMRLVFTRGT